MAIRISKRFLDRAKQHLRRYQKILTDAQARDVNESDTVVIVSDMLADLFGYDKYADVKVSVEELRELVRSEVVKRELLEGEKAANAESIVKRAARRQARARALSISAEQPAAAS